MKISKKKKTEIVIDVAFKVVVILILGLWSAYFVVDTHVWLASALVGATIAIAIFIIKKALIDYIKENP